MTEENGDFKKALALAAKRLSVRSYYSVELALFLKKKGVAQAVAIEVVRYLKKEGYLDDEAFCLRFCQGMQAKGKSVREIYLKAKSKGIDLNQIKQHLGDETEVLEKHVLGRYACLLEKNGSFLLKQKAIAQLMRRGFTFRDIQKVVNKLLD